MAFNAKYRGECIDCDDGIHPGELVEFNDDRDLHHVLCSQDATVGENFRRVPRPVCGRCFCVMVSDGVGGWFCGSCDD